MTKVVALLLMQVNLLPAMRPSVHHTAGSANKVPSFCRTGDGWEQEWSDEFEGDRLDTGTWEAIGNEGRGPTELAVGPLSTTACRRAECRSQNVAVSNGLLRLKSERSGDGRYFTGAVTTRGHRAWADSTAYRLCVSARLPGGGRGVWPAHWMLPDNGLSERCLDEGEVDITEMINSDGQVYNTFHWMNSWPGQKCASYDAHHKSRVAVTQMPPTWSSEFHEYALERSAEHMAFVIDGRVMLNFTAGNIGATFSHAPFFLILNTAIGGGWPGDPTMDTVMPLEHAIDYVRTARRKPSTSPELTVAGVE